MSTTLTIPTFETQRLIIRAPRAEDFDGFAGLLMSDRAAYIGGKTEDRDDIARKWGNLAGQWVMRGYGTFVVTLKDGTQVGSMGLWHPVNWPEPEFGWTLWSADHEGNGYVTEAMRTIIPWAWTIVPADTIVSYIVEPNAPSLQVAKRLGATLDQATTTDLNAEGGIFYTPGKADVLVYRHHKGGLPQ